MKRGVVLLVLILGLTSCGSSNSSDKTQEALIDKTEAALIKACSHFDEDGKLTDIYGMEKDFARLARLDTQYLRLAEIATNYIEDFYVASTSRKNPQVLPPQPRVLQLFCQSE